MKMMKPKSKSAKPAMPTPPSYQKGGMVMKGKEKAGMMDKMSRKSGMGKG